MEYNFSLYHAAIGRDELFSQALERQFGKDACNARYQPTRYNDDTRAAHDAWHAASDLWMAEMNKTAAIE